VDYAAFLRDAAMLSEPRDLKLLRDARGECDLALGIDSNYAFAHDVLGGIMMLQGDLAEADSELRTALRLDPRLVDVHIPLGAVALSRGRPAEAVAQYTAFLDTDQSNPRAHLGLGEALFAQGRVNDATNQYAEALRLLPRFPEAHHQMAAALALLHNPAGAVAEYRMALAISANRPDTLNNLAWMLATDPHAEIRNGADAVKFASEACRLTQDKYPMLLGTLAAAYAEAGNFDLAIGTAQQAHDLAVAQGNTNLVAKNNELLALFRTRMPYREK
jgi:Tfp pilus assembly protein PilF